jgi:presenilin-like A22 family membrane protease
MLAIFALFIINAILATLAVPEYEMAGMRAFEDPSSVGNSLLYFGVILAFTAVMLVLSRVWEKIIHAIILLLVVVSGYYILSPFIGLLSLPISILMVLLLVHKPSWITIDISAMILAAGVTAIFGISLQPLPVIVLLLMLAAYDFIAVYKTGHMVDLADSVVKLKLPMLFIIPKEKRLKGLELDKLEKGKATFMGVGDVVMPNILVVSATAFGEKVFLLSIPSITALAGALAGLYVLMKYMEKREGAHPGLPFLNGGAVIGYFLGLLIQNIF